MTEISWKVVMTLAAALFTRMSTGAVGGLDLLDEFEDLVVEALVAANRHGLAAGLPDFLER